MGAQTSLTRARVPTRVRTSGCTEATDRRVEQARWVPTTRCIEPGGATHTLSKGQRP